MRSGLARRLLTWAGIGLGVCLGVGVVGAAPARADGEAMLVDEVVLVIDRGDASGAAERLSESGVPAALAGQPELVRTLCERATLSRARFDACEPDEREALAEALHRLAERCAARQPGAAARRALAHALVLCERAGAPALADAWTRSADLLEAAYAETPDEGEPLADAVSFLLEGACRPDADVHGLTKRAGALARRALRAHEGVVALATRLAAAQFRTARLLLEERRKDAKEAVRAGLDYLRPHTSADVPDRWVATLWNDAVTFGKLSDFVLREHYLTVPEKAAGGRLEFALPLSHWWSVTTVELEDPAQSYRYVSVVSPAGAARRQVIFRRYDWTQRYAVDGPNDVNGDNVKNLAKGMQSLSARNVFQAGATLSKVRKGSVNTALDGYSFDICGLSADDGQPLRLWGGYFRGKRQTTYAVLVYDFTGADGFDPSMEAFVESLREVEE